MDVTLEFVSEAFFIYKDQQCKIIVPSFFMPDKPELSINYMTLLVK